MQIKPLIIPPIISDQLLGGDVTISLVSCTKETGSKSTRATPTDVTKHQYLTPLGGEQADLICCVPVIVIIIVTCY